MSKPIIHLKTLQGTACNKYTNKKYVTTCYAEEVTCKSCMKTTKADLIKALQTALSLLATENIVCIYGYGESESLYVVYPQEMEILAPFAKEFLTGREFDCSVFEYILADGSRLLMERNK